MARVTHVKKAQQRYVMVETGGVITTNRTTKRGRTVTIRKSVPDKNQPLPPHQCDFCWLEIKVGTPYKWIAPRSGPYGGTKRYRHEACPTWQVWEYNFSLSSMIMQAQYDAEMSLSSAEDQSDFEQVRDDFAAAITELAEQKNESADNIESGFGHETYQSEELRDTASQLEDWASEIESWQTPDEPDEEDLDFDFEDTDSNDQSLTEAREEQLEEWREDARSSLQEVIDQSPV